MYIHISFVYLFGGPGWKRPDEDVVAVGVVDDEEVFVAATRRDEERGSKVRVSCPSFYFDCC